jgi:hypothetical protein
VPLPLRSGLLPIGHAPVSGKVKRIENPLPPQRRCVYHPRAISEHFFEKQFEPYLEGVAFARHPVFY